MMLFVLCPWIQVRHAKSTLCTVTWLLNSGLCGEHLLEDQLALHTLNPYSKHSQVMPCWQPGCMTTPEDPLGHSRALEA